MAFTVLVINIGSSSVKYSAYSGEILLINGYLQRVTDFRKALHKVLEHVEEENLKLDAVAHRIVHGGDIADPVVVTAAVLKKLDKVKSLAPLHDPNEILGIKISKKLFPVPNVAVFDTSFHQTLPEKAYTYALPHKLLKKHGIRRYGFHGISHKYVTLEAARMLKKPPSRLKMVTCHLGNGSSLSAVDRGRSVETSMGFTPLEGLVMGTRSGDLDPAIAGFLQKEGRSVKEVMQIMNKESGLLGLSGISNDARDLLASKSPRAKLALDVFCHRLTKYLGAYISVLNGVDAIVFTAGIGENAWHIRKKVLSHFGYLGVDIDPAANRKNSQKISTRRSKVHVFVIPTDEALMIARESKKLLRK